MEMTACDLCGKIFGATGRAVCPNCRKQLDAVYEKARKYLRDHPKLELRAPELAEAIGEDVRLIEIIVAEGHFDNKWDSTEMSADDIRRKRLREEIEKNLEMNSAKAQPKATYGQDRHGRN